MQTFFTIDIIDDSAKARSNLLNPASCVQHISLAPPAMYKQYKYKEVWSWNVRPAPEDCQYSTSARACLCSRIHPPHLQYIFPKRTPISFWGQGEPRSNATSSSRYIALSLICTIAACIMAVGHDNTIEICDLSRECKPKHRHQSWKSLLK